jgi:hypothetical protein
MITAVKVELVNLQLRAKNNWLGKNPLTGSDD